MVEYHDFIFAYKISLDSRAARKSPPPTSKENAS